MPCLLALASLSKEEKKEKKFRKFYRKRNLFTMLAPVFWFTQLPWKPVYGMSSWYRDQETPASSRRSARVRTERGIRNNWSPQTPCVLPPTEAT
jgi:ABC-type polysaccharide transport system permease subunit